MLDLLFSFLRAIFYTAAALAFLFCLPFIVADVSDNWNDDAYPHRGFTPDCPEYIEPENTLPPTID